MEIKELSEITGIQEMLKTKYLGVYMTNRLSTLFKDNYEKLNKEIKKDLGLWKNLQLSLLGQIAAVKMNILPRLMFLFQVIPIQISIQFLIN